LTTSNFAPPVDVYEDEHNITLKIEVPGIDEKDINVTIENNTLTVRGERRFEKDEKEENFHRVERMYGSFTRSFTLPNVDLEQVSAHYEKGVLKITSPGSERTVFGQTKHQRCPADSYKNHSGKTLFFDSSSKV
jgi:HSP20 family protein